MAKWLIGLAAIVAAALVWILGPWGAGSASKENKYLESVPADTVFYLGASSTAEISEFLKDYQAYSMLPSQAALLNSKISDLEHSRDPLSQFLHSIILQFQTGTDGSLGSLSDFTGMAKAGDAVIYLHGAVPVMRSDADAPQKFISILEKAAADSEMSIEQRELGALTLRTLNLAPADADIQVALAIAATNSSITLSFIAASDSEEVLLERFGETLPASSLKDAGTVKALQSKYGYSKVFTSFIDIEGLVKAFVIPDSNGLRRDLDRYLPEEAQQEIFGEFSSACRVEFAELAEQAPRFVSGYSDNRINGDTLVSEGSAVFELLNADVKSALMSMRGHVPGYVNETGEPVLAFGLGLDMDKLVPSLTKLWMQFTQAQLSCDLLMELQDEMRDTNPAMLQAFLGSFDGVKGLGFALYDLSLGADMMPTSISAIISVAAEEPVTLAGMVSMIPDPSLSNLRIPADGTAAPIEHPMLPAGIKPFVAIKNNHLVLYIGSEGEQKANALSSETLQANGMYALGLNYRRAGEIFERERKLFPLDDEQCAMAAEFSYYLSQYRLSMAGSFDVSDNGIVLSTDALMEKPASRTVEVAGNYDAFYFENCQAKPDGEEFFNADGTGSAYSLDEQGACKVWETEYKWRQAGSTIHFETTADRYRESCSEEWEDSEGIEGFGESCSIVGSSESGFTCLYIYEPGEPGTLIEYRRQ